MRPELIHPLIVHFPLALLLLGATFRTTAFLKRKSPSSHLFLFSAWMTLLVGTVFAWIAVGMGEIAEDIVRKGLCQPEVLELHKNCAYSAATLFSLGLFLDLAKRTLLARFSFLSWLTPLLYITGVVAIVLAGSFGANLVYEQGAAVKKCCHSI